VGLSHSGGEAKHLWGWVQYQIVARDDFGEAAAVLDLWATQAHGPLLTLALE
jgi:hypothetical protein